MAQWHREVQLLWAARQLNFCSVFGIQVSPLGTNPTDCAHGKELPLKTPAPAAPQRCASFPLTLLLPGAGKSQQTLGF